jgi:hypothetical protein
MSARLTDAEANARLRFAMDDLPAASVRIQRLYVYQWIGEHGVDASGHPKPLIWDSGLIERTNGQRRGMYTIFKNRSNP